VGSAICRRLGQEGYGDIIVRTRHELDLRDGQPYAISFTDERPEYVFLAAAKVGGILANSFPAGGSSSMNTWRFDQCHDAGVPVMDELRRLGAVGQDSTHFGGGEKTYSDARREEIAYGCRIS